MNKTTRGLLALALLNCAAIGIYLWQQGSALEPQLLQPSRRRVRSLPLR